MSKHKRKKYIEGPSARAQRAARRIAATNKIRPRTFTRTNENPSPTETCGEIFATGMMLERSAMLPMMKLNSYAQMGRTFRSRLVSW